MQVASSPQTTPPAASVESIDRLGLERMENKGPEAGSPAG